MIVGIGNDIVKLSKFVCAKEYFLERAYTKKEVEAADSKPSFYAANFSVKESVGKAFGTGVSGFELNEVEVLRDERGKPYVNLYGKAKQISDSLNITNIFVSITDLDDYVITMVVAEKL